MCSLQVFPLLTHSRHRCLAASQPSQSLDHLGDAAEQRERDGEAEQRVKAA
jgi:hypothetical protein